MACAATVPMETPSPGRHRPVLLAEVVDALAPRPGGLYVDATVGPGGHATAVLEASAPDGRVVALDRDPAALIGARESLRRFGDRVTLVHADFRELPAVLDGMGHAGVDGILADLGIGSHQLDDPSRGFSFSADGPLDMRMDPGAGGPTAADLVNRLPERALRDLLRRFGEERAAARVARAIVRTRREGAIERTAALAAIVERAVPARGPRRIHPATRTFQALRIEVNRELDGLDAFIRGAVDRLRPGGRIAIVAFHSLEDRIVKSTLRSLVDRCTCPPGLPTCVCGREPLLSQPRRRPVRAGDEELAANPRARSARLRWGIRL